MKKTTKKNPGDEIGLLKKIVPKRGIKGMNC
jgi:hypothetical protein